MGWRDVGVRSSVQGFTSFMTQIRRVSAATEQATRDITRAIQKEELAREKLTLAIEDQHRQLDKLTAKYGEGSRKQHVAEIGLRKLELSLDDVTDSLAKLNREADKSGGIGGLGDILTGLLGGGGLGGLAGLGAIFAMPGIAKGVNQALGLSWGQILSKLLIPLKLVIDAFKLLVSIVGKVIGVLGKLLSIIGKVAGFFFSLAKTIAGIVVDAVKSLLSLIGSLVSSLLNLAGNILQRAIGAVFDLAGSLAGFMGKSLAWAAETAGRALQALMGILGPIIEEAWSGAEAFQRLSIRFQGLVANEIKASDATISFGQALEMAQEPAAYLLRWMQQLAVATPFSRRDISETMAFAMAMGFTAKEAQDLTLAIGEHVAGMGLESDIMERIILQFGQMQAGGRLYGTELRDLARGAFVPVNDILKRVAATLNMTAREWQELAARGETDIRPFFEEFIKLANERFPGAMERMNNTLTAVKQNFHDFVTEFLGVKALGPALNLVSDRLNKMLAELLSPEVMAAFEALGRHIENMARAVLDFGDIFIKAFFGVNKAIEKFVPNADEASGAMSLMALHTRRALDEISGFQKIFVYVAAGISLAIDAITKAFTKTEDEITAFAEDMRQTAVDAFKWGFNIITQLALGIIRGAAVALTAAMNFVGNMLASWLGPGSPPRVAPDLPEWGAVALQEWLHGMTEADFSILETIQGPLRQALGILEQMGVLTRNEVGPLFAEWSRALIEAFSGGGLGQDLISQLTEDFDELGEEIAALVDAQYALVTATEAVEAAEEALANARERHTKATAAVAAGITEYNRMLREGAGATQLAAQRELINQAQEQREIAAEDIVAAEDQLDVAQEQEQQARDQFNLQQSILNQLLSIASAQFDITEETEKTGKALKGVADAMEEVEKEIDNIGASAAGAGASLQKAFEEARLEIQKAWADMFQPVKDEWARDVQPALDDLADRFNTFKNDVIIPLMAALGLAPMPQMPDLRGREGMPTPGAEEYLQQAQNAQGLAAAFDNLGQTISRWFGEGGTFSLLIRDFVFFKDKILPFIPQMVMDIADAFGINLKDSVGKFQAPTWDTFTKSVERFKNETWPEWIQQLKDFYNTYAPKVRQWIENVWYWLAGKDGSLKGEIDKLNNELLPAFNTLLDTTGGFLDTIASILGFAQGEGEGTVNSGLGKFLDIITGITKIANSVIGFFDRIATAINGAVTAIRAMQDLDMTFWQMLMQGIKSAIGLRSGAWNIPYDEFPAVLHRGEMVLPTNIANQIRALASPTVAAPAVVPNNTYNFGDINISDNMGWAEARWRLGRMMGGELA